MIVFVKEIAVTVVILDGADLTIISVPETLIVENAEERIIMVIFNLTVVEMLLVTWEKTLLLTATL